MISNNLEDVYTSILRMENPLKNFLYKGGNTFTEKNKEKQKCPQCDYDLVWDDWEQSYHCFSCDKNFSKLIVENNEGEEV